ncbi:hypothetical protein SAMN02910435_01269 [Ruminococcaceae bacterium D5]|nr:hypothetical protein SAMN02910435_01269 [Ruminococcaceae bacterium D5]
MKKRGTALLLAFALLLALLCACGQQAQKNSESPIQSASTGIGNASKPLPAGKKVAVSEMYSEEGRGTSDDGIPYNYSYHVPQIDDNTPDADSINEEISHFCGVLVDASMEEISSGGPPSCNIVAYESYRSGDVLSLVLKYTYYYDGFEGYAVYNYDTAKGVRLTNEDMLDLLGVSEEQYLSALRRAAAKGFDDTYHANWLDLEATNSGGYQELRLWTISAWNLSVDLPRYLDDGVLHVIVPIGSPAGAGFLYRTLALELEEDASDVETAQLGDYLTVTRRGNTITLRVRQTPQLEALLGEYGLINVDAALYDKDLTVNGLYGNYTKILCAQIGEGDVPYVFLLTEEGRVEYINALACLECGYFCGSGPLLGVDGAKELVLDPDRFYSEIFEKDYFDAYAVSAGGERVYLWDLVSLDGYTIPRSFCDGEWTDRSTIDSGSEIHSLRLADGNGDNFYDTRFNPVTASIYTESYGTLTYLGMTEKGMVYGFQSWSRFKGDTSTRGAVALSLEGLYDGSEITLCVAELSGTPLMGEGPGSVTRFVRTYG